MSDEFYQLVKGVSEAATKPICKLIDAVQAGAGLVYEPIHVKRMAKAEAEALIIHEHAELALNDLRQRAAARLTNTEMRRQENIESIVETASQHLPDQCSDDPVDKDWMADFFDCCKDIGDKDVQAIWGKLLAGEVAEPGTFSRRALNTLKLMNAVEAAIFQLIGFRVWRLNNWPVLLIPGNAYQSWPDVCPFTWNHISLLADIDLVEAEIKSEMDFMQRKVCNFTFDYCGLRYVGRTNPLGGHMLQWVQFTRHGVQMLPLVEQMAGIRDKYFDACNQFFLRPGWAHDESSEFRELSVPDDIRESLNLNKPAEQNGQ